MWNRKVFGAAMLCVFATYSHATIYIARGETLSAISPSGDLIAVCHKAKADFHPLTQKDVDQAKIILIEAIERLDRRLELAGENGDDWRIFLKLTALREQLQPGRKPDMTILEGIRSQLNSGYEGLELVWFLDVNSSIRNFTNTTNAVGHPAVKKQFDQIIETLAAALEAYSSRPTTDGALTISESLDWLEAARQTPELVRAIQDRYVHPNLLAEASVDIVGAGIAESIDDITPVYDCILGTEIHGTAHTVGQIHLEQSPHPSLGVLDITFLGNATSDNVGYNGPVTIFSNGSTGLAARKRIWIDADGLSSYPTTSNARTSVEVLDIQSHKDRRLIERMAWKRAGKQLPAAEAIASRHAEERLNRRIDERAAESLDRANQDYIEKLHRPFTERKLFPKSLQFSTTECRLSMLALVAGESKLAAPGDPPPAVEGADMSLRIHESMINNLAFDALAGRTIYEEKLQESVINSLGRLPEKMQGDDDGKPWAVTFAARQPISVSFADGGFQITIRGLQFYKGRNKYPGMVVSASYRIEKMPIGFKAVRQGDIRIVPIDLKPGMSVDAHRETVRTLLDKRFQKILPPEIIGEGLLLPGKWKAAGKMQPFHLSAENGWLTVAWKRSDEKP